MRNLGIFIGFLLIFSSCHNDPAPDKIVDSVVDTLKTKPVSFIDTSHVDTSHYNDPIVYDCSVLKRVLPNDSDKKQIRRDLQELYRCGIDSFDFLYVVPNLFPGFMSENHIAGNRKVTYGDFMKHLAEFKSTDAYQQLHVHVATLDSLKAVPFNAKKVHSMKPVLGKLGFTEEEWEQFEGFANTYPIPHKGFTWGEMVEAFDKYKPEQ